MPPLARSTRSLSLAILSWLVGCRAVLGIERGGVVVSDDAEAGIADAEGDGGAEAQPLVSVYCQKIKPPPGFCDDFDQDPFEAKWDNYGTTPDPGTGGGATIEPDTTQSSSSPRSARMRVPPLLPNSNAVSVLVTTIPKGLSLIEIFADVRVDTEFFPDEKGHFAIMSLSFVGADAYVEIRRSRSGAALQVWGQAPVPLDQPFPVGTWKNVELRFAFGVGARVIAYVDGVPAGEAPLPSNFERPSDYPRVAIGPGPANGPMGEARVNVDNVVIRGTLK